jgi:methionyl aminopeptidase
MISVKSPKEIERIRESCRLVVQAFAIVEEIIQAGISTKEIDRAVSEFIRSEHARAAFKGFNGYPANTCISIEEQVVHGVPGNRILKEGEIVSVDIGVEKNGYYGDAAKTFAVGTISEDRQHLMKATHTALYKGIAAARPGNRLSDISHAIQRVVEGEGFSVVRDLVGHGIGTKLHEPPQIPNYGRPHHGPRLRQGLTLAIEPMVNMGGWEVQTLDDKWTVTTLDGLPSAHYEHTVAITDGEPDILTIGL